MPLQEKRHHQSFPSVCEDVVGRREMLITCQLEVSSWKEASLDLDPTVNRETRCYFMLSVLGYMLHNSH